MPSRTTRVPKYRRQKSRNLAVVTINGKDIYLGEHGSPPSHQKYERLIAEWLLHRDAPAGDQTLTVCELMVCYLRFAKTCYVKNGDLTSEFACITAAMRPVRRLYEALPVTEFGPKALKTVQKQMIQENAARTYINAQIKRVQRMFKWGVSEELIPAEIYQALATVCGLRKGRTDAIERPPVRPVADSVIDQTIPHLPPVIADLVRLQRLSGARPGEVVKLCPANVDCSDEVWAYRVGSHKTEHHQKQRVVFFGPKAQAILSPYLLRPPTSFCFSPIESEERRLNERHQKRRIPLHHGNGRKSTSKKRRRTPADQYSTVSYRRAIHRACDKIGIKRWSPNRIRHTIATDIRKRFGLEAAQTVLGHSNAAATQIYAERDLARAAEIVKSLG